MKWGSSILLIFFLCFEFDISVRSQSSISLKSGDFLFVDLDCGPLCDAIEAVTSGYGNLKFSHVGMIAIRNDSIFVMEAIGKAVKETHLPVFLAYSKKKPLVGRFKPGFQNLVPEAIRYIQTKMGFPYDEAFLPDNGKYYCSELLYEAFLKANNGKPVFGLEPMTYKDQQTGQFFPAWVSYFDKLKLEIPEGKPGCNPGGLSRFQGLEILGEY